MAIKIIIPILLLAGLLLLSKSFATSTKATEPPIDKAWWDGLSKEWKTIFIINQNFQKQRSDVYSLQEDYINRNNSAGEEDYSEMNKSLHDFAEMKKFGLGYPDFYIRAQRTKYVIKNDQIDLATLANLDKIYMVHGPGDLTPLKKFTHLKVLIINDCGVGYTNPVNKQLLDLEPLRYLLELEILQCSSSALGSLEPIKDLIKLEELNCSNSKVTSLAPLKNLVNLRRLTFGSNITSAALVSEFENLEELYIKGCRQIPDLSKLTRLKKLSIEENELAIINAEDRIANIDFLKVVPTLQFIDLDNTSYKGSLAILDNLQNLKAITLPPVNSTSMLAFKKTHPNCIIINAYQYER